MRSLFLILGMSFFLASCSFGSSSKTPIQSADPTNLAAQTAPVVSYTEDLKNASSKIKDTAEFENCMKPSVNMCLSQVGNELARTQKSPAICDELMDQSSKDSCKFGVIMIQATESKDIKACDVLSDNYKHECRLALLRQVAVDQKSIKACDALSVEFGNGSGSMDQNIQNMQIDQCKMNVLQSDASLPVSECASLSDKNMQTMCTDLLKTRVALPPALPPVETETNRPVTTENVSNLSGSENLQNVQ